MLNLEQYFTKSELIPTVVIEDGTNELLMLAYMNKDSLKISLDTGYTCFFSRSRQKLWKKGETSGNVQKIISIDADCDLDTLKVVVKQTGPACHTGSKSCFFNKIL